MKHMKSIYIATVLTALMGLCLSAQQIQEGKIITSGIRFEHNAGQWPQQVQYMTDIPGARVFIEKNTITSVQYNPAQLETIHEEGHHNTNIDPHATVNLHAYKMNFLGAASDPLMQHFGQYPDYRNYYKGKQARWRSDVKLYEQVRIFDLYPGVDVLYYTKQNNLKYDFIVAPGADAALVHWNYQGIEQLSIDRSGALVMKTSVGVITEHIPLAYQTINGEKKIVKCRYRITNGEVGFEFPNGYDKSAALIIDPILVASTYSGSTATNYGHCATYDAAGNIYTGAISFGPGYPVTPGAIQSTFGGQIDIAISKLSSNGSALLYATYLGSSTSDYPHSLVVDANNELFVYGTTAGNNFPTTAGAFDQTFNGTSGNDMDIIVSKFNTTGTVLIGSTFVGGSGQDGNNTVAPNYGDTYRGEVIVDAAGNPYIASVTRSINFPVTPGSYDNTQNGAQDGVVFKMNPLLTAMTYATYVGGTNDDACFSLRLSSTGDVYVAGATNSNNFPTTGGAYQTTAQGNHDGFIIYLSGNASVLSASTIVGTAAPDYAFFLDLDQNGDVFIYGQSDAPQAPTAGAYGVPGSAQYISKFNQTLTIRSVHSVFGDGTTMNKISPTAFMVDICGNIYAAGWGAIGAYTVSPNCIQPITDGNDFYLLVLDQNATSMVYATYFGANGGWEHVDGGTSRFDPNGIVYEAICQGAMNYPTTPGAYAPNNLAGSYDVAVFKIDFQAVGVNATATAAPSDTVCVNQSANFSNGSLNAVNYLWDFGDGSPIDTSAAPSHAWTTAGTYTVTLIAIDSLSCNFADTFHLVMTILPEPIVNLGNDTTICGTFNIPLNATNSGCTYLWSTGATSASINVNVAGTYWVVVDNGLCSATDTIVISTFSIPNIGSDTTVCEGVSLLLDAGNPGSQYNWNTGATTQTIIANTAGIYWVDVSSGNCSFRDSIVVMMTPLPTPDLGNDTLICPSATLILDVTTTNSTYVWSDGSTTNQLIVDTAGTYYVTVSAGQCVGSDTIVIGLLADVALGSTISLCEVIEGVTLDAGNPGSQYLWSNGMTTQTITVTEPGTYWVNVINNSNCNLSDTIEVVGETGGGVLYVPNTFTPNENGNNDRFFAVGSSVNTFEMQIFNRWGQLIYTSNDINAGWDGKYKGQYVQMDTYVVRIEYTTECDGLRRMKRITHVNVLR